MSQFGAHVAAIVERHEQEMPQIDLALGVAVAVLAAAVAEPSVAEPSVAAAGSAVAAAGTEDCPAVAAAVVELHTG